MWGHTFGDRAPKGSGAGAELTQTPTPTAGHSELPVTTGIPLGWAPPGTKTTCKHLLFFGFLFPFIPVLAAD